MTVSRALRWIRIVLASLVVALATAAGATAGAASAHTARTCGVGEGHGFGYTYLTSLTVKKIGCGSARKVVKHRGGKGWRCTKRVQDRNPVQYDARVTCKSGSRQVIWTFTEDT
jgi:hypothetical protein